ncbi:CHAT domain-containing tetratricopeptide repeat protein [Mucilaginibacter sp.]|jgi:CHAT domain-containing protein|uniref:CHAT domain-containing protein n=1 Tax=Mucilaginibacter sp. TaxID=1882438 RepID=UPI002B73C84A|nr:CHAT domain-containing tetratricopeptide repeat protein [Mucilaginibacter sp.]HTI61316.1 CHAT domain-containing tetratricopeptide repeat protein [Mucilaginibacter sp.]
MNNLSTRNYLLGIVILLCFAAACHQPAQKNNGKPATIAGIDDEFYNRGNTVRVFELASSAANNYRQQKALKQEAQSLLRMADAKLAQGNYPLASQYIDSAKQIDRHLSDDSLATGAYMLQGQLYTARLKPDSAKLAFVEAEKLVPDAAYKVKLLLLRIGLYKQIHQVEKVDSLSRLAMGYPGLKDLKKGYYYALALANRIQFFNDNGSPDSAFSLSAKLKSVVEQNFPGNNYLRALLYQAFARSGLNNMDYDEPLKNARVELEYARQCGNATTLFNAYYDVQQAYTNKQDHKNALLYADSMAFVREASFPVTSSGANLVNITYTRIFTNTHDYSKAKFYARKSIALNKAMFGDSSAELSRSYSLLGNLYSDEGKFDSMLYYSRKVLKIRQAIYPKDHLQIAFCLDDIARTYNNMDKGALALPYQKEVERIYLKNYGPAHSYMAWAYDAEADSYAQMHQFDKAVEYNDRALGLFIPDVAKDTAAINRTSGIPFDTYIPDYLTSRVVMYTNRAINSREKSDKIKYLKEAYRVADATDKYMQSYTRHFDSPENVSTAYQRMYDYYKICADIAYRLYQLTGEDRYRNSVLNYAENKRGAFLRSSILNSKAIHFSGVPDVVIKEEAAVRSAVTAAAGRDVPKSKKESVNKAYQQFLDRLAARYSNYYRLKYLPYQLNEKEIQQWLPNDSTAFAEYLFSKERIYILVTTKSKSSVIGLEHKDSVVAQIGNLRELLKTGDAKKYYQEAYAVYSNLVQPLEQYVKPGSKIIISADGPLSTLSFEALPTRPKPAGNNFDARDFLFNKYNFSYAVSAFSLLNPFNKADSTAEKKQVYFSAPGFDDGLKDDYKRYVTSHRQLPDNEYLSYLYQPFMLQLGSQLAGKWKVREEMGRHATESDFKSGAPGNNIVQVGSHAILNDIDPMRSCLVFAKELTTDKDANDGYLYSSEIYNQKINADLVVLTACETGGGLYKEGEGMMSLSYSFEYAGCKSAIMSLWPIDEKAASDITANFYKHVALGESTSDALYHAKKDFLSSADGGLVNPFYWSGLVLLGQNEKIQLEENSSLAKYGGWLLLISVAAAISAVGFIKWRRRSLAA